jgi:hypothetical protein
MIVGFRTKNAAGEDSFEGKSTPPGSGMSIFNESAVSGGATGNCFGLPAGFDVGYCLAAKMTAIKAVNSTGNDKEGKKPDISWPLLIQLEEEHISRETVKY